MKRVVNAVVRIEYNDNGTFPMDDDELRDEAALGLTISPNFNTVDSGISIDAVHVEPVVPYQLIDWYKLENNPEYLFIKQ